MINRVFFDLQPDLGIPGLQFLRDEKMHNAINV
jgi:hypothetical protein